MKTHSLLDLLNNHNLTKEFYKKSQENYFSLLSNHDFSNLLTRAQTYNFIKDVLVDEEIVNKILEQTDKDDLFEDDVFCFALQEKFKEFYKEINIIKIHLSLHNMYKESIKEKLYKEHMDSLKKA